MRCSRVVRFGLTFVSRNSPAYAVASGETGRHARAHPRLSSAWRQSRAVFRRWEWRKARRAVGVFLPFAPFDKGGLFGVFGAFDEVGACSSINSPDLCLAPWTRHVCPSRPGDEGSIGEYFSRVHGRHIEASELRLFRRGRDRSIISDRPELDGTPELGLRASGMPRGRVAGMGCMVMGLAFGVLFMNFQMG